MWVSLRKLFAAASTVVVAIVLAICVPVSQLHTVGTKVECCCPDPEHCKCPDHQPDDSHQPSMRACHKTQHIYVAPVLPAFLPPVIEIAIVPDVVASAPVISLPAPHPAPSPRRPDAPS